MTTDEQIRDCESTVAQIRRNIADLQSHRDELLRRIEGLKRAIGEIEGRRDIPGFRLRILELEGEMRAVEKELEQSRPELEGFRDLLHAKEQQCWNHRRHRGQDSPSEDDLRKIIADPRYWRDGDPDLAAFVSEGFKRIYPDDAGN